MLLMTRKLESPIKDDACSIRPFLKTESFKWLNFLQTHPPSKCNCTPSQKQYRILKNHSKYKCPALIQPRAPARSMTPHIVAWTSRACVKDSPPRLLRSVTMEESDSSLSRSLSTGSHSSWIYRHRSRAQNYRGVHHFSPLRDARRAQNRRSQSDCKYISEVHLWVCGCSPLDRSGGTRPP